jgi:serine/threonine-protein kinase
VQSVRRAPVRRFVDDRPVVYPHKRSWLKRMLMLLVLAGGGYAAYHYHYLDRLFERAPVAPPAPPAPPALPDPPPTAAAVATPEPPPAIAEPAALEPVQAQPTPELSAKEQRRAARAAIIAERWRERRAARRGRDSDSSDERDTSTSSSKSPSYASAQDDYVSQQHAAAQSGVLRINSLPWSQIHVDGELVGHTPQMNLLLPAGKHRVTLVNNEMQLSKSLTVLITAGNITTHTINLAE